MKCAQRQPSAQTFNRYFWKYLSKFLFVALILSLVLIPMYGEALRSVKETSIYAIQSDLNAGFDDLNQTIFRLRGQALIIASETNIARSTGEAMLREENTRDYFTLLQAKKFFGNSVLLDNLIVNAYVIAQKNPVFLSNSLVSGDRGSVYGSFYEVEGYSQHEWEKAVLQDQGPFYFLPSALANWMFVPEQLLYKHPTVHLVIPISAAGPVAQKAFVYLLSVDEIFSRLKLARYTDSGFLYLTDKNGQVLASQNYEGAPLSLPEDRSEQTVAGETYTVLRTFSPKSGITATLGVPEQYFQTLLAPTRQMVTYFSCCIFLVALLASIFMAYRQNKPISKAMEAVKEANPTGSPSRGENEYEYIAATVTSLNSQRKRYEEEVQQMSTSIRNTYLDRLLYGKIYTEADFQKCRDVLGITQRQFLCMAMRIWPEETGGLMETLDLTTKVNRRVQDFIAEKVPCHCLFHNAEALVTQLCFCLPDSFHGDVEPIAAELSQEAAALQAQFGILVTFGVGTIVSKLDGVGWSAKCAWNALRFTDAKNVLCVFDRKESRRAPLFSIHQSQKLSDLLTNGEEIYAEQFLQSLAISVSQESTLTEEELCQVFYGVRSTFESAASTVLKAGEDLPLPEFSTSVNVKRLLLSFIKPCSILCSRLRTMQTEESEQKKNEMVEYVRSHYTSSALCAMTIAETFGVAEKYVFSVIKANTGESLGDFVEKLRFQKAEELLRGRTDISEIPGLIGFNSVNTFYKAFKRIYGISPGKWRESAGRR